LLNVSPKANGIIPENQQAVLLKMGAWLEKYGEAIYATRPWYAFGEGPTKEPVGHFKNHREFAKVKYNAQDIRYTSKGNTIYATFLGSPTGKQTLAAFAKAELAKAQSTKALSEKYIDIKNVTALGSDEKVLWSLTDSGLIITTPSLPIDTMATVFKIELTD